VGARRLRNTCLGYLAKPADERAQQTCLEQFRAAACMTDSLAAVSALAGQECAAREEALTAFFERAKANKEALVLNKWLGVQASAETPSALQTVRSLMEHEAYDATNPNSIRSLIQMFASANPSAFHAKDGSGYEFIGEQVLRLDQSNPQVASRLCGAFNTWRRYDDERQGLMKAQLERILAGAQSKDTKEIAQKSLA